MNYRLFLTREATKDATDGYDWYESKQAGLGSRFLDEIDKHLVRILEAPFQFPKDKAQHVAVVRQFPYRIVFEIDGELIIVYAIYHDKRDPGKISRA